MPTIKSVTDFMQWIRVERLYNEYCENMHCHLEHQDFLNEVFPTSNNYKNHQDKAEDKLYYEIYEKYPNLFEYTTTEIEEIKLILTDSSLMPKVNSLFFRGQGNQEWTLLPSVFRDDFLEGESAIYNDALSDRPSDFSSTNTILENLIIMQHHGLPTRLLDVTSNPLVALYFACQNIDLDGRVFMFDSRLSSLKSVNLFTQYVHMEIYDNLEDVPKFIDYDCNHSYSKDRLLFQSPKINNRVIAQAGTFFIYGHKNIGEIYNETYQIDDEDRSIHIDADGEREDVFITLKDIPDASNDDEISVLIPKKNKEYILNELNTLNINQASLFLDLDNYSAYVKSKYK